MNHITFVKPDYFEDFVCIGGACRNNCCHSNWKIYIDKQTYKEYRNFKGNKEMAYNFSKFIKKDELSTSDAMYAHLVHLYNPTRCAFEQSDGLCQIHTEMGASKLSRTCRNFPRKVATFYPINWKDDRSFFVNQSMVLGCEVVVSKLLNNKNSIQLNTETRDVTNNELTYLGLPFGSNFFEQRRSIFKDFYFIISIAIAIIQNRKLRFEDRLILLGLFCSILEQIESTNRTSEIVDEVTNFINSIDEVNFSEQFANITPDLSMQSKIFMDNSLNSHLSRNTGCFDEIHKRIRKNLFGSDKEVDFAQVNFKPEYLKSICGNTKCFLSDKQHFLENIFVAIILKSNFPFSNNISIFESFQALTYTYIAYKFFIASFLSNNTTMTNQELIDITALWGRTAGNLSESETIDIINSFNQDHHKSLAEMVMLIK